MEVVQNVNKDICWKMQSVWSVKVLWEIALIVKVEKFVKVVNKIMSWMKENVCLNVQILNLNRMEFVKDVIILIKNAQNVLKMNV